MSNPIVTITMEDGRIMRGELYPEKAPNTVNNFISLANKGFYDGLTFHRVIPGFMIQGGCPNGNGMGGPGYEINGEFAGNGFRQNDLIHETGVLSMARTMAPNSAGSQFFVMVAPAPHLDGQYAAFGKITEGHRPGGYPGRRVSRSRDPLKYSERRSDHENSSYYRRVLRPWPGICPAVLFRIPGN